MNSNKKPTNARGIPQPFNRQVGQFKPVVAQLKTPPSAQSIKRPVAPPVYRPQPTPKVAQRKIATNAMNRQPPSAPPVYRPQVPKVLQTKSSSVHTVPTANRPLPSTHVPARDVRELACPSRFPIQRTIWIYKDKEWQFFKASKKKGDDNKFPRKKKKFTPKPQEGDYYDDATGEHHRQGPIRQRLKRARERHESRKEPKKRAHLFAEMDFDKKTGKKRVVLQTPHGVVRVGRGRYKEPQPYATLAPDDWGPDPAKEKKVKINYDDIHRALDKSEDFDPILKETLGFLESVGPAKVSKAAKKRSRRDSSAGAILSGLLTIPEPHKTRNPVGGKPERAAVRFARRRKSAKLVFNRKDGAYPAAWEGGTGAWRRMIAGEVPMPLLTLEMLREDLSESSGDEADDEAD